MNRHHRFLIILILLHLLTIAPGLFSQNSRVRWKRRTPPSRPEVQLFHSPHAIDLPTATTLQKWEMEFEISHLFVPTTGSGIDKLYGLDGPVNMRLALGVAVSDRALLTLGRSNVNGNMDLLLKYRLLQYYSPTLPVLVAMRLGGAWNTNPEYPELSHRSRTHPRNFQALGQIIVNVMLWKKLGLGLVPSYLYNTDIRWDDEIKDTFRMGTYVQYYVSPLWSLVVEWTPFISGYRHLVDQQHTPLSLALELETGGHFFKLILTNNKFLNSTQFLAGTDIPAQNNDWRLGFQITRLLKFNSGTH